MSFRLHVALACSAPYPHGLGDSDRSRNVLEADSGGWLARDRGRGGSFGRSKCASLSCLFPATCVCTTEFGNPQGKVSLEITTTCIDIKPMTEEREAKVALEITTMCVYQANDRGMGTLPQGGCPRPGHRGCPHRRTVCERYPLPRTCLHFFPASGTLNATGRWRSSAETPFLASSHRRKPPTTTALPLFLGSPKRRGRGRETEQPARLLSPA
jgi:hypothetical protein